MNKQKFKVGDIVRPLPSIDKSWGVNLKDIQEAVIKDSYHNDAFNYNCIIIELIKLSNGVTSVYDSENDRSYFITETVTVLSQDFELVIPKSKLYEIY